MEMIDQGWESSSFHPNSGFLMVPGVIVEIRLNLGRKFVCVFIYLMTVSCRLSALQPLSCPSFYPHSVWPKLARRRTVWKWPSDLGIHAFHGGL